MEEKKYILICARGTGRGLVEFTKIAEEMRRRQDEAMQKELMKICFTREKERELLMDAVKTLQGPPQRLSDLEELKEIPKREPTPEEIKRRLKYAKNPMEIQQLNRQLAKAYKEQRRKGIDNITHKTKMV